jgi:hypothetical protein
MRVLITFINETTGVNAMWDLFYFCLNVVKHLHTTSFFVYIFKGCLCLFGRGSGLKKRVLRHVA